MYSEDLISELDTFLRNYYHEDICTLANEYPRDSRSLHIDWSDLYAAHSDFADDLRNHPTGVGTQPSPLAYLHEALYRHDTPIDKDLESDTYADAHIRVHLPDHERVGLSDLRSRHRGRYVAIQGQVERVTQVTERITRATWRCTKCSREIDLPQPKDELQEPDGCPGSCSGKPSFELDTDQSTTVDERKLRLTQPPEDADGNGEELTVYLTDDLAFRDGERGMMGMSGERVTVHGVLKRDQSQTRGRNAKPLLGMYCDAHALDWEGSVAEDIDIESHRDAIEEHIAAPNTLERLQQSTAPGIQGGERMAQIKRAIILFLFRAQRKAGDASALRGDIHMALVGDPSTGKTQLLDFIESVAPRVERLSATDSTGAGLTATAEQDEFAGGNWVLTPGLLPLASGGHAIIDEIDKMSGGIDKLHEAMETQRVNVAKAGMRATLKTEAGVIIAANPEEGRFDSHGTLADEIDLPPALFSRFDIIHTLQDRPDEDIDDDVADAVLSRWQAHAGDGSDGDGPPVALETYRAWIALAQEHEPTLTDAAKDRLREWYVEERGEDWDDNADVIPITARSVPASARLAEAHARVHLRDEITVEDAEVAIDVIKAVMGDVYLDADGRMDVDTITEATPSSQKERRTAIERIIREGDGLTRADVINSAEEKGIDPDKADHAIDELSKKGAIYNPADGGWRTT